MFTRRGFFGLVAGAFGARSIPAPGTKPGRPSVLVDNDRFLTKSVFFYGPYYPIAGLTRLEVEGRRIFPSHDDLYRPLPEWFEIYYDPSDEDLRDGDIVAAMKRGRAVVVRYAAKGQPLSRFLQGFTSRTDPA